MKQSHKCVIKSLFLCILTVVSLSSAVAQEEPPVNTAVYITGPRNGAGVYDDAGHTSPFYEPTDGTIRVAGLFTDVSDELISNQDVAIFVNGSQVPASVSFTSNRTVDGVLYHSGLFLERVPLDADETWPMRQLVAEIVHLRTFEALARDQISVYDLRSLPDANNNEPLTSEFFGLYTQLTDRGLGHWANNDSELNLEKTQNSILPQPSLSSFNEKLTNRAREIPRFDADANVLNECVDLTSLSEEKFVDTSKFAPYDRALKSAKASFRRYKIAKALCNSLGTPAGVAACKLTVELTHCIKKRPEAKHFKLCVDQIEGDVQSLQIEDVTNVGMNFESDQDEGRIASHISVSKVEGKVNGYLRSLSVKWKNALCISGPKEEVDDSYITQTRWLNNWATCKNIVVKDGSASTRLNNRPGFYKINRDDENEERPEVLLDERGNFVFDNPSLNANKGICKEDFIHPHAESMAESFRSSLESKFENTWYSDSPNTMEAAALTKILEPYRFGELTQPKHDIFSRLEVLASEPQTGLQIYWRNTVTTTDEKTLNRQKQSWFRVPQFGLAFSQDGRDHLGRLFDISYSINTEFLNRLLNVRNATPAGFSKIYKPTWRELEPFSVTRPASEGRDDVATLNSDTLEQFDRSFSEIGNKRLQIVIRPIFDPIVYMPPDVTSETEVPDVGVATVYGIEGLEVTFKEKDRTVDGEVVKGKEWLKLAGNAIDKDFYFSIDNNGEALFLIPHLVADLWKFNIVDSALTDCVMAYSGPVAGPSACENRMERNVARLIKGAFRENLIELLSRVPAPQFFDADGEAGKKFRFGDTRRRQDGQKIVFYGLLQ